VRWPLFGHAAKLTNQLGIGFAAQIFSPNSEMAALTVLARALTFRTERG
jgi:hypothetical protein